MCLRYLESCLYIASCQSPCEQRIPEAHSALPPWKFGVLTCFLSLNTLNRSKSVRFFRRSCCSRFFAQLDSAHFLSTSCFSHSFFTGPVPAAFGRLGMTQGVRETVLVGTACRGTTAPSFVEGPSTKICVRGKSIVRE